MLLDIPVYVINLDSSKERLALIEKSAENSKLRLRRVAAIDGKELTASEIVEKVDVRFFERNHGKRVLPTEIGCYLSHLKALDAVINQAEDFAVIVEDDVVFYPEIQSFLTQVTAISGWDAIKLVNHRTRAYVLHRPINDHYSIGRCAHGPCGSAAAYIVTRIGAAKLSNALLQMQLPYDVAFERGWSGGYSIFSTNKALVGLSEMLTSTILGVEGPSRYRDANFPFYRRVGALTFRIKDYFRRMIFAISPTRLLTKQNENMLENIS